MKIVKICVAVLFLLAAVGTAAGGIYAALENSSALPVLVEPSQEALDTAEMLLQAVSDGDYETAGSLIQGSPDLGVDREPESEVGKLLWNAYQESLEFTAVDECFATESGVAQLYSVRYMDLNSVTANLRQRSQALLEKRVAEAENVSEVYDENNDYREDVVMDVLYTAAQQALEEDAAFVETTFTVNLVYQDGSWWAVPDSGLLSAISGTMVG